MPVSGLSDVTAISAGAESNLALLKSGTVMAWGGNYFGLLGDGLDGKQRRARGSEQPERSHHDLRGLVLRPGPEG